MSIDNLQDGSSNTLMVSENTLEVFDLTEPSQPALLASQAVGDEANQVAVNNEFVFVATSEGINVFARP